VTRFVVDAEVLLKIAAGDVEVHGDHQLVAPGSLRSQAQALLYAAVREGRLDRRVALERLERLAEIKVRLLNDRVSRRVAWTIAEQLDLPDSRDAEYLAVAQLQAEALVTDNARLARLADGIVPTAGVAALRSP
jgi:predicted nucleic acid-binding protein